MFVSLQIWPLFASKIIVSHICEELLLQQGKKKFVKIAFVFVLSCFLADRRRRRKSRSNFLTLIKGGQLVTFLQCQQKKLMRAKKFYFSCFVCRNTFRKLQTYWVKNQFVVHKFQFGTKIEKV